jgi:EmrB/QacA subfamily drug resistance transporter
MVGPHRLPCETLKANGSHAAAAKGNTRWVLPATILGSSMSFIDGSVVNVALPAMQRTFGTSFGALQWVMNGYLLALASLILLGGAAGDRLGRRRVFIVGLCVFVTASIACALAPSSLYLVLARFVQGVGSAMLTPTSLAIIGAAYRGEARGPAIGTWAAAGALMTALGPPLGGWLVDTVGWRSIFFLNVPVGVAALLIALKLPKDGAIDRSKPLDYVGAALATIALGLLTFGLISLGEHAMTRGGGAVACALPVAWMFVRRETRAHTPMMPLTLFRDRSFSGANALTLLLYAALGSAFFLLPLVLIQVHGYSATAAGAALLPFAAILGLGSRAAGALGSRMGPRWPLIIGPSVAAAGFAILSGAGHTASYVSGFLPGLAVVAIGMTVTIAPLTTTVFDSAPTEMSGIASGVNNAAARAGSLVAIAALGLLYSTTAADTSAPSAPMLASAYMRAMFAAAVLAGLSALTAALTIRHQTGRAQ